jgi:hypothetical protein
VSPLQATPMNSATASRSTPSAAATRTRVLRARDFGRRCTFMPQGYNWACHSAVLAATPAPASNDRHVTRCALPHGFRSRADPRTPRGKTGRIDVHIVSDSAA